MIISSLEKARKIFISYVQEDLAIAKLLYDLLKEAGFTPWINVHDLAPGIEWDNEIKRIISECDHAILCLSNNAARERGFVHREWRYANEEAQKFPEGYAFVLPIRLDDCIRPQYLSRYNIIDCFTTESLSIFIEKLKGNRNTEKERLLRYKNQLNAPDLRLFIQELYQRLSTSMNDPLGCLIFCVALLKGRNLVASNVDIRAIELVEKFLPNAMNDPELYRTALYLKAFVKCDYYEKRGQATVPTSKQILQLILDEKLLPDMDLLSGMIFSPSFSGYLQQILRWIK